MGKHPEVELKVSPLAIISQKIYLPAFYQPVHEGSSADWKCQISYSRTDKCTGRRHLQAFGFLRILFDRMKARDNGDGEEEPGEFTVMESQDFKMNFIRKWHHYFSNCQTVTTILIIFYSRNLQCFTNCKANNNV